jgi:pimeloyl-ACP methyl ester carboxylesterase
MSNFIKYRKCKIHYTDTGNGEPLFLIHGYLETSEIWKSLSERLSVKFRVITIDLPGHGLSDICEDSNSMEFFANVVRHVMDFLAIDRVFLTGHSLGGYITLAFLDLFPERLTGYCLFHSHPFADSPEAKEKRNREISIVAAGKKDLIYPDNVMRMFASSNIDKNSHALARSEEIASGISTEGIIAVLQGMLSRSQKLSLMESGVVPCLWILGALDNYIPCEAIRKKVNLPANAELVVLENSGHLGFVEEEERSVEILTAFIKKIASLPSQ